MPAALQNPDTGPDTGPILHQIPLDAIDDRALTRDRAALDQAALLELRLSIAANGVRLPVELFELAEPEPPIRFGLISGLRRLAACRAQLEATGQARYRTIPAFIRAPGSLAEALAGMVEENEIRAELSPWERGRIAALSVRQGVFPTIEEAVSRLYAAADHSKRSRLRSVARLLDEFDGCFSAPERLSLRQLLRLSNACRMGFGHIIRTALAESSAQGHDDQWRLVEPIVAEAERLPADAASAAPAPFGRRIRPTRILQPRADLTIRREQTRDGYSLHFTGKLASSDFCDRVFDEIERLFAPASD